MRSRSKGILQTFQTAVILTGFSMVIPYSVAFAQAPDNSKANQQDRDKGSSTAEQQGENQADRDLARKIRKSIVGDKSLSTYAHNIKVIARGGTVILKGPVRSEEENVKCHYRPLFRQNVCRLSGAARKGAISGG